ncbi:MAG TPA: PAS-domain containing protein, partial [Thermohalobaculum sp.]|nr:PAS-domain containing protein [Thermohalobaculum sp.]
AEAELARREDDNSVQSHVHEALTALLEGGNLIAWSRDATGAVRWAGGAVASPTGVISADALLAELPRPPRDGAVPAQRTRLEIVDGQGGSVPLHVVEVAGSEAAHGYAVDATASVSAERTLARFVQTMTETFAHLTVGLAIFDRNRSLALFNPALVQMWQIEASRLVSRPSLRDILDTLRMNRRIPEVADFRAWRDELLALLDDPEKVDYDALWHLPDGSNVRVFARPHPHGLLAFVFDDVTERMRLEQRFRHSIELRRATLDRLDEGLAVFGADGMLQFMNSAFHRIWGSDPASFGAATHARDLVEFCAAASVEAEVWDRALSFITAESERRAWSARLTLGTGRILSARVATLPEGASMIVFVDITDSENMAAALRERNEALEAAEEMRTAVLERVSQRLRTPLDTVFDFARLLSEDESDGLSERQRGFADGILEAAGQLLDAIDDVTELTALQLEPLHDETAPHRVWETLALVAALLRQRAEAKGASLGLAEATEADAHLVPDLPALRQIVFALAAKAIERARPGARIVLAARAAGETTLEVEALQPCEDGALRTCGKPNTLIGRLTERAGGEYELIVDAEREEAREICRFPGVLAPPEEAEPAGLPDPPEPPELIDEASGDDPAAAPGSGRGRRTPGRRE